MAGAFAQSCNATGQAAREGGAVSAIRFVCAEGMADKTHLADAGGQCGPGVSGEASHRPIAPKGDQAIGKGVGREMKSLPGFQITRVSNGKQSCGGAMRTSSPYLLRRDDVF